MRIIVSGSIATDHLMRFPGKFTDSLVADQLNHVSLSFLVDDLVVHRGGAGANISFGLGCLGLKPILVGAVGVDFVDYRSWLERHGVNCDSIYVSEVAQTARFVCTTDEAQNQIASFYAGAMSEARNIELSPIINKLAEPPLVLIGPDDPEAMIRRTDECRQRGYDFAADPSQQLARMDGDQIRLLIDGAKYLFTNEYEAALTEQKTGWSAAEILQRVQHRITTLGAKGARVESAAGDVIEVGCPKERTLADPTGVGDGFRAGFLAGVAKGLSHERAAQIGATLATLVIENVGPQEYRFEENDFISRILATYGEQAAEEISAAL
ncbi:MAG: carbohydrate kinase family protein [Candidatus Nanopelagicales bacterium]